MINRLLRFAAVLLPVAGGLVLGDARPAQAGADCLEVTVVVQYEDGGDEPHNWYPLGGPRHCVLRTPWPHMLRPHYSYEHDYTFLPDCAPDRVFVEAYVPLP